MLPGTLKTKAGTNDGADDVADVDVAVDVDAGADADVDGVLVVGLCRCRWPSFAAIAVLPYSFHSSHILSLSLFVSLPPSRSLLVLGCQT